MHVSTRSVRNIGRLYPVISINGIPPLGGGEVPEPDVLYNESALGPPQVSSAFPPQAMSQSDAGRMVKAVWYVLPQ